jgi:hypothetical protein
VQFFNGPVIGWPVKPKIYHSKTGLVQYVFGRYCRNKAMGPQKNLPSVSFMLIAVLSLCTGINFLPIKLRSKETWVISGLTIRILECFSVIVPLGRSELHDPWVRFKEEPWTELNPIGFLPRSEKWYKLHSTFLMKNLFGPAQVSFVKIHIEKC